MQRRLSTVAPMVAGGTFENGNKARAQGFFKKGIKRISRWILKCRFFWHGAELHRSSTSLAALSSGGQSKSFPTTDTISKKESVDLSKKDLLKMCRRGDYDNARAGARDENFWSWYEQEEKNDPSFEYSWFKVLLG